MSALSRFFVRLSNRRVGTDRFGNSYYESRAKQPIYQRTRRFVLYAGAADPTMVPPEWHAWLHHTVPAALAETRRYPWQQEHQPNLTGTAGAYRPAGHDYAGGARRVTGGDYEAWTPGA